MKAESIDRVILNLDEIIRQAKINKRRLGYFAALYRRVTIEVKKGIEADFFDDGERMEKLDILFANRYLEAYSQYAGSGELPNSWRLAFDATRRWRPTVLQHLFLAMNAHIDLDLGVAAAECVQGQELSTLRGDFDKINQILISLLNDVQGDLAGVWPLLRVFDFAAGDLDETLSRFGIEIARGRAWRVAEDIASQAPENIENRIRQLDQRTLGLGKRILAPGRWLQTILMIIRLGEIGSIPRTISLLED